MKETLCIKAKEDVIGLASDITYMQKPFWCGMSAYPLKLSFLKPRTYFPYDRKQEKLPLVIFLCGGGFQKVDRNAFVPELVYLAKNGFAVASVDYSTRPTTQHPEQITEVKTAVRFFRHYAEDFNIDPERIAVMGESAGAYLANMAALTADNSHYRNDLYEEESDRVQAVVSLYSPCNPAPVSQNVLRIRTDNFPDLAAMAREAVDIPPVLMFHGDKDFQVSFHESEALYEALTEKNADASLYILEGSNHGDAAFFQTEVKEIILDFLNKNLK